MKSALYLKAIAKPSPLEAELDLLIDLRANRYITESQYRRDKAALMRAMANGGAR